MKYLVGGSYCNPSEELIEEAFEDLKIEDEILLVAYSLVDDLVAEFAHKKGIKITKEAPDNPLRGNNARFYAFKLLAREADVALIFYKRKEKEAKELIEIAETEGVEVREFEVD